MGYNIDPKQLTLTLTLTLTLSLTEEDLTLVDRRSSFHKLWCFI